MFQYIYIEYVSVHSFPSDFFGFNKLSHVLVSSDFRLLSQIPYIYIYSYMSLPGLSLIREIHIYYKKRSNSLNISSSSDAKPDSAAIFIPSNMGKTWTFVGIATLKSLL